MENTSPRQAELHDLIFNCRSYPHCGALDHFPSENARLIAASSDLLDAAKDVIRNWVSGDLAGAVNYLESIVDEIEGRVA